MYACHCSCVYISYAFTKYRYLIDIAIFGQYHIGIDIISKWKSWCRVITSSNKWLLIADVFRIASRHLNNLTLWCQLNGQMMELKRVYMPTVMTRLLKLISWTNQLRWSCHNSRHIVHTSMKPITVICFCHNSCCLAYFRSLVSSYFSKTMPQHTRHASFQKLIFHKVVQRRVLRMVGYLIVSLLRVYSWV